MPLVQHNNLPSIERISLEGIEVCSPKDVDESLASIKIGFLNMMPDAAISATERQFLRLLGSAKDINCYVYPFSIKGVERSPQAQEYIDQYYIDYPTLKTLGVDALVITGANVSQPLLQNELFWPELIDVIVWAKKNTRSTLCSCLATHAAVKVLYNVDRQHLGDKCWGVFEHKLLAKHHPLVKNIPEHMLMCHSRFNDVPSTLFNEHGVDVLIASEQVGVQLATEKDLCFVYFQGHPEYDDISLLKEYKREIIRYVVGDIDEYPPVPLNYFNEQAMQRIADYKTQIQKASDKQVMLEQFPEDELKQFISNPWKEEASAIFSNWISLIAN